MKYGLVARIALVMMKSLSVLSLPGCFGLAVSQLGKHYQTEKADGLDEMKFKKIGV